MNQYDQAYKDIVEAKLAREKESAVAAYEYLKGSTARYHGRCIGTMYLPKIFSAEMADELKRLAETMHGILVKVIEEYLKSPSYRALFDFPKELEELILQDSGYTQQLPIARVDVFYNEETRDFWFCEINTDGSSAMNEDRELNLMLQRTAAYAEFAEQYRVETYELFDSWVAEFSVLFEEYLANGGKKRGAGCGNVAVLDFLDGETNYEFEQFRKSFEAAGFQAEVCDIRRLRYEAGVLYAESGMPIDAIYRRAVTCDIMEQYAALPDFLAAVREHAVCVIGDFRTQVVHNKLAFLLLRDPQTKAILTEEENAFIEAHVPYTTRLRAGEFDLETVLGSRRDWVIKPEDSYASKGVHAGVECKTAQEWERHVREAMEKGHYLLQRYCLPYKSCNLDLYQNPDAEFDDYSNITGIFVYNGKSTGLYARISRRGIISTQYSELALPTIVVSEREG